jgi:large subunit ribosomal protein L32
LAVPKRKTSKSKRDKRRTHHKLKLLSIVECPRCHSKKISHRVCENCGYYAEHEIIIFEEKGKEKGKAKGKAKGKKETTEASKKK